MTRRRSFALKVCSVLAGVVFFLVLAETRLAIVPINTKSNIRLVPGMGSTYLPHAYYRHTKEGFSEGYFNSHGFRDYERSYTKPPGTFRIVVLGDSYVEGMQVALENTFPALLEKKLNENSGSIKFEVLNLGQSGFGTADEYMRYLNFGVRYHPDLVILALLTGNDIQDNSKVLHRENVAFYFRFDENGNLVLDRSVIDDYERSLTLPKKVFQFIKRHSYLASLISERLYLVRLQIQEHRIRNLLSQEREATLRNATGSVNQDDTERLDLLSNLHIYLPDMGDRWKEAFAITKALLLKFKQSVEENGSRFLLVTLSNAAQVEPQLQERLKEQYGLPFDFDQPDRLLEELAKREGITHLQLMPAFREFRLRTGEHPHGFGSEAGHWNESGHRLATEKIFEFLREKHLLNPGETDAKPGRSS